MTRPRRHRWGPGRPRLTREQRATIRVRRAADQASYKVLAADFDISIAHAWRVCQETEKMISGESRQIALLGGGRLSVKLENVSWMHFGDDERLLFSTIADAMHAYEQKRREQPKAPAVINPSVSSETV